MSSSDKLRFCVLFHFTLRSCEATNNESKINPNHFHGENISKNNIKLLSNRKWGLRNFLLIFNVEWQNRWDNAFTLLFYTSFFFNFLKACVPFSGNDIVFLGFFVRFLVVFVNAFETQHCQSCFESATNVLVWNSEHQLTSTKLSYLRYPCLYDSCLKNRPENCPIKLQVFVSCGSKLLFNRCKTLFGALRSLLFVLGALVGQKSFENIQNEQKSHTFADHWKFCCTFFQQPAFHLCAFSCSIFL